MMEEELVRYIRRQSLRSDPAILDDVENSHVFDGFSCQSQATIPPITSDFK